MFYDFEQAQCWRRCVCFSVSLRQWRRLERHLLFHVSEWKREFQPQVRSVRWHGQWKPSVSESTAEGDADGDVRRHSARRWDSKHPFRLDELSMSRLEWQFGCFGFVLFCLCMWWKCITACDCFHRGLCVWPVWGKKHTHTHTSRAVNVTFVHMHPVPRWSSKFWSHK